MVVINFPIREFLEKVFKFDFLGDHSKLEVFFSLFFPGATPKGKDLLSKPQMKKPKCEKQNWPLPALK